MERPDAKVLVVLADVQDQGMREGTTLHGGSGRYMLVPAATRWFRPLHGGSGRYMVVPAGDM